MTTTYETRTVGQLVRWDGNPRPPASAEARTELKASIAHKGVNAPLIVRHKSGPKKGPKRIDEVIGGDTRRSIVAELYADGTWDADREVPVIVRDDLVGDDAAALDVALSDNIHLPTHPIDQFHAFSRMVEMGRDLKEIGNAYGVGRRIVEQRLSLAKLDERARDMLRNDERDLEWAAAMTMATLDEQRVMLDEMAADPRRYQSVHDVRRRLEDELVATDIALFDVSAVTAGLVRKDLFDPQGATYLKRSEFQPLQDAATEARANALRSEGWSRVTVVSERDFDRYRYDDGVADKNIAEVVLVRYASGAVIEHSGLALRLEERINGVDAGDDDVGAALFADTPETARALSQSDPRVDEGKKTQRYVAVSRAVIIQAMVAEDPRLAMAFLLAGMIGTVAPRPVDGKLFTDMPEMDPQNPAVQIIERKLDAARQIMESAGVDPSLPYGALIDALLALDEHETATLLQVAVARRISTGMARIDMMFDAGMAQDGATLGRYWRPDRTYLATLSREALDKVARQTLPAKALGKTTGSKGDVIETLAQILEDAHEGGTRLDEKARVTATAWAPAALGGAMVATGDVGSIFGSDNDQSGQALFGGGAANDDADESLTSVVEA